MINQLKSMETTLAGSLRREQMAEISIKQLDAEVEQLNRLVRFFFFWEYIPFQKWSNDQHLLLLRFVKERKTPGVVK
jgi:hypothetical protein